MHNICIVLFLVIIYSKDYKLLMVCRFCNKNINDDVCKICCGDNMIYKSMAKKKYGLTDRQLSKLNGFKKGAGIMYVEDDIKKLFDELSDKLMMKNDNDNKIVKKKKIMSVEDERIRNIEHKKYTVRKMLMIYLEKSEKKHVALYNRKISALISSYLNSSLTATEIASGICFEIEKCIVRDKESNNEKISMMNNSHKKIIIEACDNLDYKILDPTEEKINNIDDLIYKNFDSKYNSLLKNSSVYKQYIAGKIYSTNDALKKMKEIVNNVENRHDSLYNELEKYGITKKSTIPQDAEKYVNNYFNDSNVDLKETVKNIVKICDFWRIVFFNYNSAKTETKYLLKLKNMFLNDKISNDGLVREFVSVKIRMSSEGWDTFKQHNKIKHHDIDIHIRKKIDKALFDFFDSEEIDLLLNNMDLDTYNYVHKRCNQLTLKCKKLNSENNKVSYDISKPINLMGEKL